MTTGTTEIHIELEADDILQFLADEGERLGTQAVAVTWLPSEWELTYINKRGTKVEIRMKRRATDPEEEPF